MSQFVWEEKYDVGVRLFNEQHKQLLNILRDVYKAMEHKQDKAAIAEVINNLIKYAKEHLTQEEACLKENKYPDFENHKNYMKYLFQKLSNSMKI